MKKAEQVVFVIDDDPSMCTAIRELIEAVGLEYYVPSFALVVLA